MSKKHCIEQMGAEFYIEGIRHPFLGFSFIPGNHRSFESYIKAFQEGHSFDQEPLKIVFSKLPFKTDSLKKFLNKVSQQGLKDLEIVVQEKVNMQDFKQFMDIFKKEKIKFSKLESVYFCILKDEYEDSIPTALFDFLGKCCPYVKTLIVECNEDFASDMLNKTPDSIKNLDLTECKLNKIDSNVLKNMCTRLVNLEELKMRLSDILIFGPALLKTKIGTLVLHGQEPEQSYEFQLTKELNTLAILVLYGQDSEKTYECQLPKKLNTLIILDRERNLDNIAKVILKESDQLPQLHLELALCDQHVGGKRQPPCDSSKLDE